MPTPQREPLRRLTRAERTALQRIVNSTSERVDQVRRAAALLAVARTSGSRGTGSGVGKSDWTSADGASGAGTGATQRMAAEIGALTAQVTTSAPLKGRRIGVPAASGLFEPVHDVLRRSGRRAIQRAVADNPLHGFGHIQPRATQGGVQR